MKYEKIKESLEACPDTFVGALLTVLLERAAKIPVFKPGGLVKLVEQIEEKHQTTGGKELATNIQADDGDVCRCVKKYQPDTTSARCSYCRKIRNT